MKKIYMKTFGYGNISALHEYYENNLKLKEKYIVEYVDFKQLKETKFKYLMTKIKEKIQTYDIVISDYPSDVFKKKATSFFVNHGYGTKKTPSLSELNDSKVMNVYNIIRNHTDYIITLSERDELYFLQYEHENNIGKPQYIPLGLPRNDFLYNNIKNLVLKEKLKKKYNIDFDKKVILYTPTWRSYDTPDVDKIKAELSKLINKLDEKGWELIYRPHHLKPVIEDAFFSDFNNCKVIDSNIEMKVENLMLISDCLITDYSSIFLDYLILDNPIIFWIFDYDLYKKDRGLEFDIYNQIDAPGRIFTEISKLDIDDLKIEESIFKASKDRYIKYQDGNSSRRIWEMITKI